MFWNTIKNEIQTINNSNPIFMYICVGGATHIDNNSIIEPNNYHQFPPYLQHIKNTLPNVNFIVVLIDGLQETPPRVAHDYNLQEMPNTNQTYYSNNDRTMKVFVLKEYVCTDVDEELFNSVNTINITNELKSMNTFAKNYDITLLYDTFTGRDVSKLAYYFDLNNNEHLDQIVYGIGGRNNHGCETRLTDYSTYYPYRLDTHRYNIRPIIKLYNYYNYIVNNTYSKMTYDLIKYPREMHEWAELQKTQLRKNKLDNFKNNQLTILRQIRYLINGTSDILINFEYFEDYKISKEYSILFKDLYENKEYALMYELFSNYISSELDIVIKLTNIDINGEYMLDMITTNDDPYKWYDSYNNLLSVLRI